MITCLVGLESAINKEKRNSLQIYLLLSTKNL